MHVWRLQLQIIGLSLTIIKRAERERCLSLSWPQFASQQTFYLILLASFAGFSIEYTTASSYKILDHIFEGSAVLGVWISDMLCQHGHRTTQIWCSRSGDVKARNNKFRLLKSFHVLKFIRSERFLLVAKNVTERNRTIFRLCFFHVTSSNYFSNKCWLGKGDASELYQTWYWTKSSNYKIRKLGLYCKPCWTYWICFLLLNNKISFIYTRRYTTPPHWCRKVAHWVILRAVSPSDRRNPPSCFNNSFGACNNP